MDHCVGHTNGVFQAGRNHDVSGNDLYASLGLQMRRMRKRVTAKVIEDYQVSMIAKPLDQMSSNKACSACNKDPLHSQITFVDLKSMAVLLANLGLNQCAASLKRKPGRLPELRTGERLILCRQPLRAILCREFPKGLRILFLWLVSIPPADKPGRYSSDYGKRRDVASHYGACTDNTAFPDGNAGQQDGTGPDISPGSHVHWTNLEIGFNDWLINREASMRRTQDLSSRAPTHIAFKDQMTCIEVRLRPNPHIISNFGNSIETSLNICLSPDENSIPDLEGFQVLKADTTPDPNTVAEFSCKSPPDGSTHQM